MRYIIIFLLFDYVSCTNELVSVIVKDFVQDEILPNNRVKSVIYKSVNKFFCSVDIDGERLLIYGSKKWTFPAQDVNLTLSYPTDTTRMSPDHYEDYIITGFRVNLYIDGVESKGYIGSGGIFEESISLTFVSSNITVLSYQFWLYGVPMSTRQYLNLTINTREMCLQNK